MKLSRWVILSLWGGALSGCAGLKGPGAVAGGTTNASSGISGDVATTEEPDEEDIEEDPNESADETAETDPTEGTPTDLGDVQASEQLRADEIKADALAQRTFPLVENEFVDQWIRYFTGRGRIHFEKWLSRSPRYTPIIRDVMKRDGLPEDLMYLAMIESGFNPIARSHAKAVGPWQFIASTGKRYGLEVDAWIDERRDIEKSTHAAAQYLKELHQIFGSWYLAAASYNAGEGKVLNAIRRDKSRNFWELARKKKNFRSETRNYVPKIIAAALISKNPAQYGFGDVVYEVPLQWESVEIPGNIDLRSVNDVTKIDKDMLKLLNAELRRGVTPPNTGYYPLRVPVGQGTIVTANLEAIRAKKYKIADADDERRGRRGRRGRNASRGSSQNAAAAMTAPLKAGDYRIKPGDTLWDLARRSGTTVAEIKRLNAIRSPRDIRPGAVIRVPAKN